jgi:hypothetical protein
MEAVNFPSGILLHAAENVPNLHDLIGDHAPGYPPTPILPQEPCFPVIQQLFGSSDLRGVAPHTDLSFAQVIYSSCALKKRLNR